MSDSIISFRSPVFALTTKQERVHHPVVSTPATIQLLRNHSCSGSVLRLYSLIVRGAEPNPSRPPQPRHSAAGPLEVTCWGQSRVKARLFLWRPVFSAAHQHSHLSQQKGTIVKCKKKTFNHNKSVSEPVEVSAENFTTEEQTLRMTDFYISNLF